MQSLIIYSRVRAARVVRCFENAEEEQVVVRGTRKIFNIVAETQFLGNWSEANISSRGITRRARKLTVPYNTRCLSTRS